jgi:hypothetical protein
MKTLTLIVLAACMMGCVSQAHRDHEPTMNTAGSEIAERQFITKEFTDTLTGKTPAPYPRLHEPQLL